jgi:hypothetical protein
MCTLRITTNIKISNQELCIVSEFHAELVRIMKLNSLQPSAVI